jgi:hypothetical protein
MKNECIDLKEVKYVRSYNTNTPSWDSILSNLNDYYNLGGELKHVCPSFVVSHDSGSIPEVSKVLSSLGLLEAHTYINLLSTKEGFGEHRDVMDVWFWQVKGSTKWTIEGGDIYILNEGDLIEVPKGLLHFVESNTPRCGISMSTTFISSEEINK